MKKIVSAFVFASVVATAYGQPVQKVRITDLEKTIAESKTPMVINFWATYCLPCLEEIPYFQRLTAKYKKDSVHLLLVSLDLEDDYESIAGFAARRKITAPIVWLDETNADYFCPRVDKQWSGAIPATLFINHRIGYRRFFENQLREDSVEKEIRAAIGIN
jgi:thiol-disulfide isomerase/thioredoxin